MKVYVYEERDGWELQGVEIFATKESATEFLKSSYEDLFVDTSEFFDNLIEEREIF